MFITHFSLIYDFPKCDEEPISPKYQSIGINELRIQKSQRLNREINHLSYSVDSLKRLFPKAISFERMIIGDLPEKYKVSQNLDKLLLNIDSSKIVEINLNKLYNLLLALDYHFKSEGSGWLPKEVFSQNIILELNNSKPKRKTELNSIYKFLKDRNRICVSFDDFDFKLGGHTSPPIESLLVNYINTNKKIEIIKENLNNTNAKILEGDDLEDIVLFTFLLLMVIIYPFRLIALSIIWAIRTLKEKPSIENVE